MARDVTALAVALAGLFLAQRGFYEVIMGGIEGAAEMRGGGGKVEGEVEAEKAEGEPSCAGGEFWAETSTAHDD